jgi:hypothetical protein
VDEGVTGHRAPLRVGLVLDRRGIPRYTLEILRQIRTTPSASLALVIRDGRAERAGGWLFRAYARLDQRTAQIAGDPIEILDLGEELAGVREIPLAQLTTGEVDLLLDGRQQARPDRQAAAAQFGWWWLRHGSGNPAGFREIVTSDPLTRVELQVARADGDLVLGHAVTATMTGLSWARNRVAPYHSAVTLVVQKLRQVHEGGWTAAGATPVAATATAEVPNPSRGPGSFSTALWLMRTVTTKIARRLVRKKTVQVWQMAIRQANRGLLERGPGDAVDGFRWLRAPAGRQYADPFLLRHENRTWCFIEDIPAATGRGRISAAEVAGEDLRPAVPVLERPYHLSYPCVFTAENALFMIPESSANGAVELYRCVTFPGEWALERILLRRTAVDSSICFRDGRYWLFATHVDKPSQAMELWLYSSESLAGEWRPHRQNPISLDVRNARGAGAIFVHDGRLFRPSQDCSIRYGRAFSLNEIVTLTPDRYEERPVVTVEPMPGFVATHSYARSGSIELIDGCSRVPAARR